MKSEEIYRAAHLLKQRERLRQLISKLRTAPSHKLALYAARREEDDDGLMSDLCRIDNDLGIAVIETAMIAINDELRKLQVEL